MALAAFEKGVLSDLMRDDYLQIPLLENDLQKK
jgi:hypothetical protein